MKSSEKILSLYEHEVNVIVRGKAGAEVEFGNTLFLGEQHDGVILDWKLYENPISDERSVRESLDRMKESYDGFKPSSATTDRGCASEGNSLHLANEGIKDYMCPRGVDALRARLGEEDFREHQTRRGQTEGRIGILKNSFLGRPLRSKGFVHRELNVAWGVLAHNLWVLARLPRANSLKAAA
ncbi:MAG: hypothetical protein GF311_27765 [Candidatus Lokiarchaeota archaeon]|nr:hypothetical protein [Candidatus Lokiarchaeota archaeon]